MLTSCLLMVDTFSSLSSQVEIPKRISNISKACRLFTSSRQWNLASPTRWQHLPLFVCCESPPSWPFSCAVSSVMFQVSRWLRSKRIVVSLQILQTIFRRPVRHFERYNLQVHLWCWWECHRSCFWTSFATRWMSWKFCASVLSSLLIGNGLDVASCWCQPVGT